MISGTPLIIVFIISIGIMIYSISKWKIHPFLAIMGISLILSLVIGFPLEKIPDIIGNGFASIFSSIGIVIILGTLIGLILEKTGAAVKLAEIILKVLGSKYPQLAMMLIGWIISIPVFCDSGFIIVNPIRKWLSKKSRFSSVSLTVALSAGLYVSHVFIPPTPGPIAAAGMLGLEENLLWVILFGIGVSIIPLTAAYFFSTFIGKKVKSNEDLDIEDISAAYSENNLPGGFLSFAPIVLPVLLMGAGSVATLLHSDGIISETVIFLGKPVIALTAGLLCAIPLLQRQKMGKNLYDITQESLRTSGPIIFITAAGSVLGKVIAEAGLVHYIQEHAQIMSGIGIFFPFVIAAILKTSQGSSTVAITTTAGIMGMFSNEASLMYALGMNTPIDAILVLMAIGAGSMTVSHANDSYFWVVTNFGGITPQNGYKTQTVLTLIMGLVTISGLFVISLFV